MSNTSSTSTEFVYTKIDYLVVAVLIRLDSTRLDSLVFTVLYLVALKRHPAA
jgi:hypothetical protein